MSEWPSLTRTFVGTCSLSWINAAPSNRESKTEEMFRETKNLFQDLFLDFVLWLAAECVNSSHVGEIMSKRNLERL